MLQKFKMRAKRRKVHYNPILFDGYIMSQRTRRDDYFLSNPKLVLLPNMMYFAIVSIGLLIRSEISFFQK